ncbi:ABC transporter permease [Pseudomonas sp.]|uniref:ABC transporter permease n=1 Tax=Pseudomonas sp. TaxID=306 RepID=UPI002617EF94|nr:ABC transporter permease [Pseudomonas sp.]
MTLGLWAGLLSLVRNRGLIVQMTVRDIEMRYKNSVLGIVWVIGQPILQLLLYGFVFQIVLRSKWGLTLANGSEVPFGLVLYAGIMMHALIADTLVRSPSFILSNTSYVKRVIFPLEVLPLVNVLSGIVSVMASIVILIAVTAYASSHVHKTILLLPIPVVLLALFTMGCGWFLSAIGVFFRDLGQLTTTLASVMLFTAPICYPAEMVPLKYRWLLDINPLTIPVECVRSLVFIGHYDQWNRLGAYALVAIAVAAIGHITFHRMRAGFADAL